MTETIADTNRNCTMDNWFSSCEVAKKLLEKKLPMVETMRKNKPDITKQLIEIKGKAIYSFLFVFDKPSALVAHVSKKNKSVLLLSTMHSDDSVDEQTKKPEILLCYNRTKGGVDSFDQWCHSMTVSRKTHRWSLRIFYGMVDAARCQRVCNSHIKFIKQ